MSITSISRDWGDSPCIVRISATDTLSQVQVDGWLSTQDQVIHELNNGSFEFVIGDSVMVYASDGDQLLMFNGNDFSTLVPISGSGSGGGVIPGTSGQVAIYATGGTQVQGESILPSTVQLNSDNYDHGTNASSSTFLRGDGVWEAPGGGTVTASQVQGAVFNFGIDSGSANSYAVSLTPSLTAYKPGMIVSFDPVNTNTTDSTIDVDGLGPISIITSQNEQISPGAITAGLTCSLLYNSASVFEILNPLVLANPTISGIQGNLYNFGDDSGVADAYVVTNSDSSTSFSSNLGAYVAFTPINSNATSTPTVDFNGNGALTVVRTDGAPLFDGDMSSGLPCFLLQGISQYILLNPQTSGTAVTAQNVQSLAFNTGTDTGTADNYIVDLSPALSSPPTEGLIIAFTPLNDNVTDTPVININGTGNQAIFLQNNTVLLPGDISASNGCLLMFSRSNFILLNPANSTVTPEDVQHFSYNYAVDSGVADAYVLSLTPPISAYDPGLEINFSPLFTNATTTPTLDAGAGAKTIVLANGPVQAGDLTGNIAAKLIYNYAAGTDNWILLTPSVSNAGDARWNSISGTTQLASVNNSYACQNSGQTTVTLPASAALGQTVAVEGIGAGGWILQANSGQTIQVGTLATTTAGSLTSAAPTDNVYVTCIVPDTTWRVQSTNSSGLTIS